MQIAAQFPGQIAIIACQGSRSGREGGQHGRACLSSTGQGVTDPLGGKRIGQGRGVAGQEHVSPSTGLPSARQRNAMAPLEQYLAGSKVGVRGKKFGERGAEILFIIAVKDPQAG